MMGVNMYIIISPQILGKPLYNISILFCISEAGSIMMLVSTLETLIQAHLSEGVPLMQVGKHRYTL
jgi:hypothetical protein